MRGGVKCESKVKYGLMFWGQEKRKERWIVKMMECWVIMLCSHLISLSDHGKWAGRDASVSLCELKQTLSFGLSLSHLFL